MRRRHSAYFAKRAYTVHRPIERVAIVVVIALVVGATIGLVLPKISDPIGEMTGEYSAGGAAAEALKTLSVDDEASSAGYDRDVFGYRSTDVGATGCDVREAVLARDLTSVVYRRGSRCIVQSGVLHDPYTGRTIQFMRGRTTSDKVQIDHVVALQNAWRSGANRWSGAKRMRFGNDEYNLLAVDGASNQEKGSASAAYWLPTNAAYRCEYVARQIGVKEKYDLSVTSQERRSMLAVLRSCPAQTIAKE
ncbi:MAG: HNH endonuclease family protein [Bifidobacterium sp.]|jgi:hypothetical protein|nr:HNH endonuclease family protein [Bifidobacterium sp.]